jgi:hypothetical protein
MSILDVPGISRAEAEVLSAPQVFETKALLVAAVAQGSSAAPRPFLSAVPRQVVVKADESNDGFVTFYFWTGATLAWSISLES